MKKFLSYILTFVMMFLLSATGTIWIAKTTNTDGNQNNFVNPDGIESGAEQTSFFTGIMETFTENKKFNVSGDIVVFYEQEKIELDLFASVDIDDTKNIKVDAVLSTNIQGKNLSLAIVFCNNTIYLSFNDVNFKATVENISDLGKALIGLVPSVSDAFEGVNLSAMLEQMLPSIMNALNNPVEETLPNGDIKNTIDLENIAVAKIVTNAEGLFKSAEVETYDIYGIKINLSADIVFDNSINIVDPDDRLVKKDYLDFTHVKNIVNNMKTWKSFDLNADVSVNGGFGNFAVGFGLLANTQSSDYQLNLKTCSVSGFEDSFIKYVNGNLYLSVQDVQILLSDKLISSSSDAVKALVMGFASETIAFESLDFAKIKDELLKIDISNVFEILSKIQKIELGNGGFVVTTDYGSIVLNLGEDKIENIEANIFVCGVEISFVASANQTEKVVSSEDDSLYFDVYKIYKNNLEFYKSTGFETLIDLAVFKNQTQIFGTNGYLSFDYSLPYLNASVNFDFGKNLQVDVVFENDIAYVKIGDVFVKMSKSQFDELLEKLNGGNSQTGSFEDIANNAVEDLKTNIKTYLENLDFDSIKDKIKSIKSFKLNGAGIEVVVDLSAFGLSGTGHFVLSTDNYVVKNITLSNFGFGDVSVDGSISIESNTANIKEFDKTKYLDVYNLVSNVVALKDINSLKLGFALETIINNKEYSAFGDVGFNLENNYFFATGLFETSNKYTDFDLQLIKSNVFAKLGDIALKIDIEWLFELVGNLLPQVDETSILDVLEYVKNMLPKEFDLGMLEIVQNIQINSREILIQVDGRVLGLQSPVTLVVGIRENQVRSFEISKIELANGNEVSFKVDAYYVNVQTPLLEEEKYLDVKSITENLVALKDLKKAQLGLNADVLYNGTSIKLNNLDVAFNLDTAFVSLFGGLVYGSDSYNFDLFFENGEAYVVLNSIKIKVDVEGLVSILKGFGVAVGEDGINTILAKVTEKIDGIKNGFDTSNLVSVLKNILLNIVDLKVNSKQLYIEISSSAFNTADNIKLLIAFEDSMISSVDIDLNVDDENKFFVDFTFNYDVQVEARYEVNEYLDICELYNNLVALKNLKNANLSFANTNIVLGGYTLQTTKLDVAFDLEKMFASVVGDLLLNGEKYDFDVYYQNIKNQSVNELYVILNNIKLKLDVSKLSSILAGFGVSVSEEDINKLVASVKGKLSDLTTGFENANISAVVLNILSNLKELSINSSTLKVVLAKECFGTIEDIVVTINFANSMISKVDVYANINSETFIETSVMFSENSATERTLNKAQYLDVCELYNQLVSLENKENLNLFADINLYKKNGSVFEKQYLFDIDLNRQLKQNGQVWANFIASVIYNGKALTLDAILQDNELFASLNNFKMKVKASEILGAVQKVLAIAGINENEYDQIITKLVAVLLGETISSQFGEDIKNLMGSSSQNITFDISKLVLNILSSTINENGIVISLDCSAFGLNQIIDIVIKTQNQKIVSVQTGMIEFGDYAIDVNISLDETQTTLNVVAEEDENKYLDLYRFMDVVDATYNTLENMAISGNMDLLFKFGGETNLVKANYGIKFDAQAFDVTAYLKATFNNVSLNLYYKEKTFFIDLGGVLDVPDARLQISLQVTDLKDLVAWVDKEFGTNASEVFEPIYDKIIDLIDDTKGTLETIKNVSETIEKLRDLTFGKDFEFVLKSIFDGDVCESLFDTSINFTNFDGKNFEAFFKGGMELFLKHGADENGKNRIKLVVFTAGDVQAIIYTENFNNFEFANYSNINEEVDANANIIEFDQSTFESYTIVTKAIEDILATFKQSPFEFYASLGIFKNDVLDFSLEADYQTEYMNNEKFEYLLLDINGMKIKVERQKLAEILSYVLQAMGIDPSIVSFIGDVSNGETLDTGNINALFPALDFGNPFSILKHLKGISLRNGVLQVAMDKDIFSATEQVSGGVESVADATDMIISLVTANNKLASASISNFFIGDMQSLDINIDFSRRTNYANGEELKLSGTDSDGNAVLYPDYIDLSESADIIRAFINTSAMNAFHITGSVILSLGENASLANLGVDIKIKLDENKKPIIEADISNYPLIGTLINGNEDFTNKSGNLINKRYRKMSIYYKDGEIVLKTVDEKYTSLFTTYEEYTQVTKITLPYLLANAKYYMQWLLTFTDTIQKQVVKAIDETVIATEFSDIIQNYKKVGDTHSCAINLTKLLGNSDIGTLNLEITTINNESTGNKDYIGYLGCDLDLLNIIMLKTDKDNVLQLVDINSPDNFSVGGAIEIVNDSTFALDCEYTKTGSNNYVRKNEQSKINLENNGGSGVSQLVGYVGDSLELPIPTYVIDDGVSRIEYAFMGWVDENGNQYIRSTYPVLNKSQYKYVDGNQTTISPEPITLYAVWDMENPSVRYYKTLTLENNNGTENVVTKDLQYSTLIVNTLANFEVENEGVSKTFYTFEGWLLNGVNLGKTFEFTLDENTVLVASWSETTKFYRTITFDTNGAGELASVKVLEGESVSLPVATKQSVDNYGVEKISYQLVGWQTSGNVYTSSIVVFENTTLVAVWNEICKKYYKVSFNTNGGNALDSIYVLEGESLTEALKSVSATKAKDGTYQDKTSKEWFTIKYHWTINTYTFAGWIYNGTALTEGQVMPSNDIELVANWNVSSATEKVKESVHKEYLKGNF